MKLKIGWSVQDFLHFWEAIGTSRSDRVVDGWGDAPFTE